jgi:hypothetical protein
MAVMRPLGTPHLGVRASPLSDEIPVPHDIFISYHSTNQEVADAVVTSLEAAGVSCWIAHRDLPREAPSGEIARAVQERCALESRALVLVLATPTHEWKQVLKEVEQASGEYVPIIVFRAVGVELPGDLVLPEEGRPLELVEWAPPVESHLPRLVEVVRGLLEELSATDAGMEFDDEDLDDEDFGDFDDEIEDIDLGEDFDDEIEDIDVDDEADVGRIEAPLDSSGLSPAAALSESEIARGVISRCLMAAYYPKEVEPWAWQTFLAYILNPSAARVVEADARKHLSERYGEYRRGDEAARRPLAVGTAISAIPRLEGFQFNPTSLTIELQEDWHRMEFKLRAPAERVGRASNGMLTFTVDGVIVADIPISIYVGERQSVTETAVASSRPYQAIFCSYSHRDKRVAERVESACKALGIAYLRDVITLRSGQRWRDDLCALIDRADVFQLFWSRNAARSEHVEREWRHALGLRGKGRGFIRPVYWEEPISPPPAELQPLHFAFVPELSSWLRRCVSLVYRWGARLVRYSGRG